MPDTFFLLPRPSPMNIYKYWFKETRIAQDGAGYRYHLRCWAGSSVSLEEAKNKASEKVLGWIARLREGKRLGEYEYRANDIREELIEEFHDDKNELVAAITRNRYGAMVLNSARILFVDIDVKPPSFLDRVLSWFKRKPQDKSFFLDKLRKFHQANPAMGMVIYETFAGLRIALTHQELPPADAHAEAILKELGNDELYKKLCKTQACYRARLTPKPWRCDAPRPPNGFPRDDGEEESAFREWLALYERKSRDYAVCIHLETLGADRACGAAKRILDIHDRYVLNGRRDLA